MAIPSLQSLADNISNSVTNLFSPKGPQEGQYPAKTPGIAAALSQINAQNWMGADNNYVFSVVDLNQGASSTSAFGFSDFPLPINPTDIQQDEPPAIKITPTQGGTNVNHSGMRYKDLTISGTTGVAPNRGSGGMTRAGQPVASPPNLKYQTGYFVFLTLRNWFRAYYEFKNLQSTSTGNGANARLVFKNFKDGEVLIVELLKFSLKRSAGRPFMYDYTLNFKVLGLLEPPKPATPGLLSQLDQKISQALDLLDTARGTLLRVQDILRQVETTYEAIVLDPLRQVSLILKAAVGVVSTGMDMANKTITNTVTTIDSLNILTYIKQQQTQVAQSSSITASAGSPLSQVTLPSNIQQAAQNNPSQAILNLRQGLQGVPVSKFPATSQQLLLDEQQQLLDSPRVFFQNIQTAILAVRDNAADRFNLGDATYNTQFNRTATYVADPSHIPTDDEFATLAALEQAIEALDQVLQNPQLFQSTFQSRLAQTNSFFGDQLTFQNTTAARQVTMPANTTLERLALNELGDEGLWVEIADMNNLKPPYVIQDQSDTTKNVLHPGQPVLLPTPPTNGFSNATVNQQLPINQALSQVEQNLGIDLKISPEFDLVFDNRGDLAVVTGAENAAQAIVLKLSYEPGDVINHPEIGVGLAIGSKGGASLSAVKTSIINSITADPRFDSVSDMSLARIGDATYVSFTANVHGVDLPIPISFKLPLVQ